MPQDDFKKEDQRPDRSRRTLHRDLIVSIVLVVTVVFFLVAVFAYGYLTHKAQVKSRETMAEFSEYLHDSLELPIWNIDEEGIDKICNSFFENALVARMKVTDHEGTVFFEKNAAIPKPSFNHGQPSSTAERWSATSRLR